MNKMDTSKFILIGGTPSSGSTLLSVLLDSHSEICCGPETNLLAHPAIWTQDLNLELLSDFPDKLEDPMTGKTWARPSLNGLNYWQKSEDGLTSIQAQFKRNNDLISCLTKPLLKVNNKKIACEKSPPNAYAIPTALKHNPLLKTIFTVRNFCAVARSLEQRGNPFHIAAVRWLSKVTMALNAQKLFGKERVFILRYEDLVSNPEEQLKSLLKFMDMDASAESIKTMLELQSNRTENDQTISGQKGASSKWQFIPSDGIQVKKQIPKPFTYKELSILQSLSLSSEMVSAFSGMYKTYTIPEAHKELNYVMDISTTGKLLNKIAPQQKINLYNLFTPSNKRLHEFCRLFINF